ncbi:1765_t:CDS:1, partial [Paraglomus occultum]
MQGKLFPPKNCSELYNRPRFTLFYAHNDSQQDLLDKAINSVNESIFKFVGELTDDNSTSHKKLSIYTQTYRKRKTAEVEDNPSSDESSAVTKPGKGK